MFIAAISTIAKIWEELRCPNQQSNEWIKELWYISIVCVYSAIKKKEILPLAMEWVELEDILLSRISQSEKGKYHTISLICGI